MALVIGTNCGFVTEAPVADPEGSDVRIDILSRAQKHVAPAGATKITEIGWYCGRATEEENFEVAFTHMMLVMMILMPGYMLIIPMQKEQVSDGKRLLLIGT